MSGRKFQCAFEISQVTVGSPCNIKCDCNSRGQLPRLVVIWPLSETRTECGPPSIAVTRTRRLSNPAPKRPLAMIGRADGEKLIAPRSANSCLRNGYLRLRRFSQRCAANLSLFASFGGKEISKVNRLLQYGSAKQ